METKVKTKVEEDLQGKIKGMFFLIQDAVEKLSSELDRSYQLYKIGEKTEISKKLEKIVTDEPGKMESDLIEKLLKTLNILGKKVVVDGFIKSSNLIESAYILSENENRILYGVVPKDESEEELRSKISEFYLETSTWEMFKHTEPLFQVIPNNLIDKIKFKSTII